MLQFVIDVVLVVLICLNIITALMNDSPSRISTVCGWFVAGLVMIRIFILSIQLGIY